MPPAQEPVVPQFDPQLRTAATWNEAAPPPEGSDYVTREEMQGALKKWSWRKGDVRIVPYGMVWGSMSADTQRTRIGDYALWVDSPTLHPNEGDFSVDAKSSRFGLDFEGPPLRCLNCAPVGGKVEIDFQGQFVTRNKPGVLLRHVYVESKTDEFRILVGQTWDVISPLYIPTLNYTAGSAVGNLAYRRAQFRLERYIATSDECMFTLQGSLNANVVTDYVSEAGVSADVGPYPDIQSRAAITLGERKGPDAHPIVLGVSGHFGEEDFDFRTDVPPALDIERNTWSFNIDATVPFTKELGMQGEFFTGENLSNYMGGILQGVDRVTHRGIRATGGFFDVYYKWRPDITNHVGFAMDNPLDQDLKMASARTSNGMIFTNVLYDATKNLQLGFEVDVWRTTYLTMETADAERFEFAVKYRL
jgi:hypothetical protein